MGFNNNNPVLPIICRIIGFLYADGSINFYERNRIINNKNYVSKEFQCAFDFGRENDAKHFEEDLENERLRQLTIKNKSSIAINIMCTIS